MAIVGAMMLTRRAFNPKIEIVAPISKESKTEK
jgi:hypothetical protein